MRCHHLVGTCESCFEYRVGIAGLHAAHHVGHIDLEDNVHTALKVETEANAPFANLIESVGAHIHFLVAEGVHVVLVGLVVGCVVVVTRFCYGIGGSLVLVLVRNECEREVEQTHQYQENGYDTGYDAAQISFALHVKFMVY